MVIKKKTSKKTKKAPKKTRRVVKKIYIENPPQPNTIEKITTYVQREKTTVIIVGIILVVIGYFFYNSDTYLKWFGLSHNNTVYDFYNSSDREKLYFMDNTCLNGKCLPSLYFKCGYRVSGVHDWSNDKSYYYCVANGFRDAESWKKLGDIILQCGKQNTYFEGVEPRIFNDEDAMKKLQKQCENIN